MKQAMCIGLMAVLAMGGLALGQIPTPEEDVVLTVTGTVALRNVDNEFHFDMNMLEELTFTEYEVSDPWLGAQEYGGGELSAILDFVGIPAGASSVVVVAADDAEFKVSVSDAFEYPIMIAYTSDGEGIPSSMGGPLKLVFPYFIEEVEDKYPDAMWSWWVVGIRVEY